MKFLKCISPFCFSISYHSRYEEHEDSRQANVGDLFDATMDDPWIYLDDDGDGNIYLHRYREFLEEVDLNEEDRELHLRDTSSKIWWQG